MSKVTVELPSKEENFSEWFSTIIDVAEIADFRYPIKGCGIWLAYGFKLRQNVCKTMRKFHDETGHDEMLFPMLIPEDLLRKESDHIKGFEDEVYWITHGGLSPLDVKLALRPTSETVMYPMYALWIRSHADMPIKAYQIVSIFRYETKATKPLIRVREVTTFKEAHTAHSTFEEAEEQVKEAISVYKNIFDSLGIPYLISRRPEWDKFAGSEYSLAFETVVPDGRTLQIGTIHQLGQNFSKAFNMEFETKDGGRDFAYQTCYGISERSVAAVIAAHGDDQGLILPPNVAPLKVVIVPIWYKGKEEEVNEACEKVYNILKESGITVKLDDRDITAGRKFYDWELKGVPIRIEIGPKDVESGVVTFVNRLTKKKETYPLTPTEKLVDKIKEILNEIQDDLYKNAHRKFEEKFLHKANSLDEAQELLEGRNGIVMVPWCGDDECGFQLEDKLGGTILGIPVEEKVTLEGECLTCGREAITFVATSRPY